MLAQPEMVVVIVHREKITYGGFSNGGRESRTDFIP